MNHTGNQVRQPPPPVIYNSTMLNVNNTLDKQIAVSTMKFGMLERIQNIKTCQSCKGSK